MIGSTTRGTLYYDGTCRFCIASAKRLRPILLPRQIAVEPFTDGAAQNEMILDWADGRKWGGADAIRFLAGRIWWAIPFWLLSYIPGVMWLSRKLYQFIAARRHCLNGACSLPRR